MYLIKPKNPQKGDKYLHLVFNQLWEWDGFKWSVIS